MPLTLNQRHCGHASLCWLETIGSAKFRAHERRNPDQKWLEDRRSRSKPRRNHGSTINFDSVRKIGLALPGVDESTAYGSPALKVHGKLLGFVPAHRSAEA